MKTDTSHTSTTRPSWPGFLLSKYIDKPGGYDIPQVGRLLFVFSNPKDACMRIRLAQQARTALDISNQLATFQRHKKVGVTEALFGIMTVFMEHADYHKSRLPCINFPDLLGKMYEILGYPAYQETRGVCERSPHFQHILRCAFVRSIRNHRNVLHIEDLLLELLTRGRKSLNGHLLRSSGLTEDLERKLVEYCARFRPVTHHAPAAIRPRRGKRKRRDRGNARNHRKHACT